MPTTRRQSALSQKTVSKPGDEGPAESNVGKKHSAQEVTKELPAKKARTVKESTKRSGKTRSKTKTDEPGEDSEGESTGSVKRRERQAGTIERGHIYFFYRPRVEHKEAHSLDDVKNMHMLLVPRPPEFSIFQDENKVDNEKSEDAEMRLVERGADAVPAEAALDNPKKHYRLIMIGKKHLPDPEATTGGRRKEIFWAFVTKVGDDLRDLEQGLGEKTYETKTRGTRHLEPARLAGRGAYAIVNNEPRVPSQRETHFGYHLSHPSPERFGPVQEALGLSVAGSFVLQVKNPLAPVTGDRRIGLPAGKRADYPEEILSNVFGKGTKGRESYGLRFSSCERAELLDYEGAELLFIAARSGESGLETSLGEGRGEALEELAEKEGGKMVDEVLRELAMDEGKFPVEPLEGHWI